MLVRWLTWRQPSGLQLAGRAGGLRPPGRGAGHAARRSGGRGKRRRAFLHRQPHFIANFRPVFVTFLVDEIFQALLHIGSLRIEGGAVCHLVNQEGNENWAKIRDEMGLSMEEGCGIYRTPELMQKTIDKLAELQERFKRA